MLNNQKNVYCSPVIKLTAVDDQEKFRPLPKPTGEYPFRLALPQLRQADNASMVFHMVGDTGSVREPQFQQLIAGEMVKHINEAQIPGERPLFLYHLGDVVYKYGEAGGYSKQFFEPYSRYPNMVYAIPGNHDSDINPESETPYNSLDAFTAVFCDTRSREVLIPHNFARKSNIQPNAYWTFETPLATIIGLYSNVPKFGKVDEQQKQWFINELQYAALHNRHKAIIVCVHHAPYSADINHGSSTNMIHLLESSFEAAGVRADIVFSGHVHNYQRFYKSYHDGMVIPYIVAGGGGYDELHAIASLNDPDYDGTSVLFDGVKLQAYCDDRHGFLKVRITKQQQGLKLQGQYYSLPHSMLKNAGESAELTDDFEINILR